MISERAAPQGVDESSSGHPARPRRVGRPRSARANEAILDAAIEEFVEHGIAGMAIERIAARAGVARSTIYRRWSSTDELGMAALEHLRDPLPIPPGDSVREDLIILLRALHRLLTETRIGKLIPQLAAEAGRRPDLSYTYWTDYLAPGSSPFGDALRRGMAQGQLRGDLDVELVIDLLTGALFKRSLWQLATTDEEICSVVDTVLAGLAPTRG